MACRTIAAGPGFTAIVCGPRGKRHSCSTPGCTKPVTKECDYPVTRKGVPGTCGAHLCGACARPGADGSVICGPHAGLLARKAAERSHP